MVCNSGIQEVPYVLSVVSSLDFSVNLDIVTYKMKKNLPKIHY